MLYNFSWITSHHTIVWNVFNNHTSCTYDNIISNAYTTNDTSIASNREIMQKALLLGAVKIALTHNHPSGDLELSSLDIRTTQDLKRACEILGLQLIDHIIVTKDAWCSMFSTDLI